MNDSHLFPQPRPEMLRHLRRPDAEPFRILVVDDEPDIYGSSRIALRNQFILSQPVAVERALSAEEARRMLGEGGAFALALVDVVMESRDAGLLLAEWVRNTLDDPFVRLVVRTGNPGVTSEAQVVRDYDLADFRTKSLSAVQLTTLATGQIRNYERIVWHARRAWINDARARAAFALATGSSPAEAFARGAENLVGAGISAAVLPEEGQPFVYTPDATAEGFTVDVPGMRIRADGGRAANNDIAIGLVSIANMLAGAGKAAA